ncbi:AMP-dependent synthetase [Hapalosiphon sp. MRB220]|nr:AMP-dependent synthetase [Hapalosiphon sp. MRB220]
MSLMENQKTISNLPTLVDILLQRASYQPSQIAYTFIQPGKIEAKNLTYKELDQQARAIAAKLQSIVAIGSRALLIYPSGLEFIAAFFGCLYAKVVAVPAYPPRRNQNMSRLQAIMADAQPTVVLTVGSLLRTIEVHFTQNPELTELYWLATDNLDNDLAQTWERPELCSNSLAFLQYTSGSTATPKGVMVSHGNLLYNSALIRKCFDHSSTSQGVIWLPPYHDMGLIGGVLQPLYCGFPVTLMSPLEFLRKPLNWLQAISDYKATTSGGPNFAYELCIRKITLEQRENLDLSSWEVAFNGAETIRSETLEQFVTTFEPYGFRKETFYPCYGMAEATLLISGGLKAGSPVVYHINESALEQNQVVPGVQGQEGVQKIVGCGLTWSNQVVIVDPELLTQCKPNQVGEIWVSGLGVAQGYWNKTLETEQNFHAYLGDRGPFLRTGDLGFLDNGELFVTGRIKDVIIIRGRNYYPQDIELTVEKSHLALRPNNGAAFSVDIKGSERLVIVHEIERSYLNKLNVNEVVGNICQAVVEQHDLQVYAMVLVKPGSIPKTSSGKIQRYACRTRFLTGSLNVVKDWSENPQGKTEFLRLKSNVEFMLRQLSTDKTNVTS